MNAGASAQSPRWTAMAHAVLDSAIRVSLLAAGILAAVAAVAGVGLQHLCIY